MPSTVIKTYQYMPQSRALVITFISGRVYRYNGVSQAVYEQFKNAFSKGSYFNRYIKPNYSCKELTA